jgi:hypothetical protein
MYIQQQRAIIGGMKDIASEEEGGSRSKKGKFGL